MQAAVKIIKSSPIGRLNRGFGNTDSIYFEYKIETLLHKYITFLDTF